MKKLGDTTTDGTTVLRHRGSVGLEISSWSLIGRSPPHRMWLFFIRVYVEWLPSNGMTSINSPQRRMNYTSTSNVKNWCAYVICPHQRPFNTYRAVLRNFTYPIHSNDDTYCQIKHSDTLYIRFFFFIPVPPLIDCCGCVIILPNNKSWNVFFNILIKYTRLYVSRLVDDDNARTLTLYVP